MKLIMIAVFLSSVQVTLANPFRGTKLIEEEKKRLLKEKSKEMKPIFRIPRHHKWMRNYADEENHDDFTTPQPTTTNTTKSPEQIRQEQEEQRRILNPKGLKLEIFGSVDDQVKAMENKMDDLKKSIKCKTNADCTNKTCCLINDFGAGTCVVHPHQAGHACNKDMCPCRGDSLTCKYVQVTLEKPPKVMKCVVEHTLPTLPDTKAQMEDFAQRLREAKQNLGGDSKKAANSQLAKNIFK